MIDNVFNNENETSRKHPQKGGTALPRIGAFRNNPTRRGWVGTSMDSHHEVSTSWDTLVYPKCSDFGNITFCDLRISLRILLIFG
jgi:hypothetical protein